MRLNSLQLEKLSEKVGQDVTTPAGATVLQLDIESVMGARLGLNTVKRLVGVLSDDGIKPRLTTLNIVAGYLGYPDWRIMEGDTELRGSGFDNGDFFMEMSALEIKTLVEIDWKPDRRIVIQHEGDGLYTVVRSDNSKLRVGDVLSLSQLAVGFPFVANDVNRDEKTLGCYRAADGVGITRMEIINPDNSL